MKQRWATRCKKCIKRQLLCTARCALPKTKQARGKLLKLFTLPSLPQTLPKHSPASCYLWMHRRSSKGELEAMSGSFVVLCPPRDLSSEDQHQHLSATDQEVAVLSSARRCRTVRAWKLRAVLQSSCESWASSKAAEAPSRAATALATRFKKAAEWGSQAAVVSATRGVNWTPWERRISAVCKCAIFVPAYAETAAKACRAAAPRVSAARGPWRPSQTQ